GKKDQSLSIMDVVFMIGPRINAAGRISHGKLAVDLLTGTDLGQIEADSMAINEQNTERKELDRNITASALAMIEELEEQQRSTTVVCSDDWHKGVIGIVASRLIETYYRPTVVFTKSNGKLSGSARSVRGFDIYQALERCDHILEQFGGHKYAAGMTLLPDNFESFKETFEEVVDEMILPEQRIPMIEVDARLRLGDIQEGFFKILKQFAPFGPENMNPVFQTDGLIDTGQSRTVGSDGTHLKIVLKDPDTGISMSGIGFGMADKMDLILSGKPISIAYHLDENEFNGKKSLQLRLKDLRLSEEVN
ncbi:MAG: single-stranded-DNA-specific exonuclease RecJ, partial [Owenweeksia sp.]